MSTSLVTSTAPVPPPSKRATRYGPPRYGPPAYGRPDPAAGRPGSGIF